MKWKTRIDYLRNYATTALTILCIAGDRDRRFFAQHVTPDLICCEVFLLKIQAAGETFSAWYPARERFPSSENFGKWAWWCHDLEKALDYFEKLERGQKPGHSSSIEEIRSEDRPFVVVDPSESMKPITVM